MAKSNAETSSCQKIEVFMHRKDIRRAIVDQLKKLHPNWARLPKKQKKQLAKDITDAAIADYRGYDKEVDVPLEKLIGIEGQKPDHRIISLQEMVDFVENFRLRSGSIDFEQYRKPMPEIVNSELRFIDKLLDNSILNCLLSSDGYSPQMRDVLPCQLFRAELLKAIKYPEISYRKYCTAEYMGQERKENRRFLGLPLNTKYLFDHTQLCQFRSSLSFSQVVNVLVYILYHFQQTGLLKGNVIHGVDSTEIANDTMLPLYTVKVGDKKIRIYNDLECDCGARRNKRDKSRYVIGYRLHTLTAINPETGQSFPLVSLLGAANHHDSLFLKPLIELAQAMGIEMKLITADEAYHDNNGAILAETDVHLITPVPSKASLPTNVEIENLSVTCNDFCEIPMIRMGLTEHGHEYKCNASNGECSRSCSCPQFRIIPFDSGHFQRMPVDSDVAEQAVGIRKNIERTFNLLKNREGLKEARVRSQRALVARSTFAIIATLLIEMAGTRKKIKKDHNKQLNLFDKSA